MCYSANSPPVDASPWSDPKTYTLMSSQPRMVYPPRSNTFIRSVPSRTPAQEGQGMGRSPSDRPSYSYRIPKNDIFIFRKWGVVPPRIRTIIASVTLGANLDGLPLCQQPRFLVSPLSYRPGRPGGGGGKAGEASRPRPPPLRQLRPRSDLQLPSRAAVACFYPRGGGGAAGPAMRPPTRRGVRPCRCIYAQITWRGTRGWGRRKVAVRVADELCLASRALAAAAGLPATPRHPPIIEP